MEGGSASVRSAPNLLGFTRSAFSRDPDPAIRLPQPRFSSDSKTLRVKGFGSIPMFNPAGAPSPMSLSRRRIIVPKASSSSSSSSSSSPIAPLQLESPVGQFLSQLLCSHPYLLPAAVDQQLDQLRTDRVAEKVKEDPSPDSGTYLVLYRRISEAKANARRSALEEILYASVVQRFMVADLSLVPSLWQTSGLSFTEEEKLEQLHSPEMYAMIKNHLNFILGQKLEDSSSVAEISKLRIGQIYAASINYGYFLKRVDQRFQLEKSMKPLHWRSDEVESIMSYAIPDDRVFSTPPTEKSHSEASPFRSPSLGMDGFGDDGDRQFCLRSYILSFDPDTLQRYATIRSKEAFSIVEKHTEALLGKPEFVVSSQGAIDSSKDELLKISLGGLRRLVLESVTFGSFLWDVESYAHSRYQFVAG